MSLDFESIKSWIVATLDADGNVRQSAEAQLKEVCWLRVRRSAVSAVLRHLNGASPHRLTIH